jgi:hypothetical protein
MRTRLRTAMFCLVALLMVLIPGTAAAQPDGIGTGEGVQPMACYEGRIPGSTRNSPPYSTHVHGSRCQTRWAQLVMDEHDSCCVPVWVKIERQQYGSYGWLTTHAKPKKLAAQAFGTHNTATVPWIQHTDQRFHACMSFGPTEPYSWSCGPWVN